MNASFRASLHDAVVKMQRFICAIAAINRKLKNRAPDHRRSFVTESGVDRDFISSRSLLAGKWSERPFSSWKVQFGKCSSK